MDEFPQRAAPGFLVLSAPIIAQSLWLARVKGLESVCALLASFGLVMLILATFAGTWRRFLLIQTPLVLLGAAFVAVTFVYGTVPGDLLACACHSVLG